MNRYALPFAFAYQLQRVGEAYGLQHAAVYAGLCWELALGTAKRSAPELAAYFGVSGKVLRGILGDLETLGVVETGGRGPGWYVALKVSEQDLRAGFEAEIARLKAASGPGVIAQTDQNPAGVIAQTDQNSEVVMAVWANTPLFGLLYNLPQAFSVNQGYVRLYGTWDEIGDFGTEVANSSYSSITTSTTYLNKKEIVREAAKTPTPSAAETAPPRKPKLSKARKADGPIPTRSSEFRKLTLARIEAEDPHWATITALHAEWCLRLKVDYPLNTWRYAAWRTALVEQAYQPQQLRDAFAQVAQDTWARQHLCDPHVMFTGNPSKIERYFRGNAPPSHDRLGRNTEVAPTHSFEF